MASISTPYTRLIRILVQGFVIITTLCPSIYATNLPEPVNRKKKPVTALVRLPVAKVKKPVRDPLIFQLTSSTSQPKVGQEFDIRITVHFIPIASGSMFFLPGSNAYSLKLILPANFNVTGGTYVDYLQDELTSHKTQADYTIRGYFTSPAEQACFRVLRGPKEAGSHSVFELRHELCLSATGIGTQARQGAVAPCAGTGSITYERWDNITGTTVADLISKTNNFQLPASTIAALTSFEGPTNIGDNYGARIRGYICPPTTGIYYFWIAGDNTASLRLNSNGIEASNTTQIAASNDWTDSRVWNRYSEQKSVGIMLTAGQQYYVEALMKQREGGDNVAVGWAKPGEATDQPSEVIPGQYLLPVTLPPTIPTGTDVVTGGKCYSIQNLQSLKYAQRLDDNTVTMTDRDVTNASQLWKADVIKDQFKFSSQSGTKTDLLYVNAFQDEQLLRIGSTVSTIDEERYRWTLAPSISGGYRIYGGSNQNTWDQTTTGLNSTLQLFGNNTNQTDKNWDKPYRRFSFTETACPTSSCNLAAVATPASIVAGATSTLTVSGGGSGASYVWKVGGNSVGSGSSLAVSPTATTTYQVECSGCGGCAATQTTVSVTPAQSQTAQLTVSPNQLSWPNMAANQLITVSSNVTWSVSGLPAEGWLTASSTSGSGSGNGSFTLMASANTGTSARTASVVVSGGGLSQAITLSQAGTVIVPPAAGECFVLLNRLTNQYLQAQSSNTVDHVRAATGQANQVWRFETAEGKLRIGPADGSSRVMYVEAYRDDQLIRLGADVAGESRYRWVKELIPGTTAAYRLRSEDQPWIQQYAGGGPALQIWGSASRPLEQTPMYGQYVFQSVGCQAAASSCNLAAVATPASIVAGATSTLTVSGGGSGASYVWKVGGNSVGSGSSLAVSPASTTTYQVECSGCGGCAATQTTVSVTPAQSQTAQLTVSPNQLSWNNGANSQIITVSSNIAWSVSGLPAEGWLTASSTNGSGSGNGSFTLMASANTSTSARTASVVVSGGGLSQAITLSQAGTVIVPPAAGECFVLLNRLTNQYLQAQSSNIVDHVRAATGQANQVWRFETAEGKLRIGPADGSNRVMYVEAYRDDQLIRLGADVAGESRYRWVKELIPGTTAAYRLRSEDQPWIQQYAGGGPALQIWGSASRPLEQTPMYGQYVFQSVGCQAAASSCNLAAVATPASIVAGATSTLTVSGGGSGASYVWKVGGNSVGSGSSLAVSPASTTTYQVECSGCGGCAATQTTVSVTPAQSQTAQLTVSPNQLSWNNGANSQIITVSSNIAWSVSGLPAEGWLTASSTSGSGNGSFTLMASANTSTSARTASVVVSGGGLSQAITLSQAGTVIVPPAAGECFVLLNRLTNQYLQAQSSNIVDHVRAATGQANQVWRFETAEGKLRIGPADGSNRVMYVEAYRDDQLIRLGADVAGESRYRWVKELIPGTTAAYRLRSEDQPWIQQYAGGGPALQIWGSASRPLEQTPMYGQYVFQSVGCQAAASSCNLAAVATPASIVAGATSTLTVSGGGSGASYVWKVGGNSVGSGSSLGVTPTATTTYQVECSSCGGCAATQTTVSVTPAQSQTAQLTVSPGFASLVVSGSSIVVVVTGNVAWSLSGLPSWVSASTTTGSGNGNFTLTVAANGGAARSVTITVSGGGLSQTILLTQDGGVQPVYNLGTSRWIGIVNHNGLDQTAKDYIDAGYKAGTNFLQVVISWAEIEKTANNFDFSDLDYRLLYGINKGMKVALRLQLTGNHSINVVPFTEEGRMVDNYGITHNLSQQPMFSPNHAPSVALMVRFVSAVATHLNANKIIRDNLIAFSLANSQGNETNYPGTNYSDATKSIGVRAVEFDWSLPSIQAYRSRMENWFGSLENYNIQFGKKLTDWQLLMPPTPSHANPPGNYPIDEWKLWYLHRHLSLKEMLTSGYNAIKAVNPLWNLMMEMPSIENDAAFGQATFGITDLVPDIVKAVKVNGDPIANHNRIGNLMLRDRAADKVGGQEVDMGPRWEQQDRIRQAKSVFAADGTMVFLAQIMAPGDGTDQAAKTAYLNRLTDIIITTIAQYPLSEPVIRRNAVGSVHLSMSIGLSNHYSDGVFIGGYNALAIKDGNDTQPVIVQLDNDILSKRAH